jgi:arylsulfatase
LFNEPEPALKTLKTYPEGTPFTGKIGRTAATSEPAWPLPIQAKAGAPNVLVMLLLNSLLAL